MAVYPTRSAKTTLTTRRSSARWFPREWPHEGQNRAPPGTGCAQDGHTTFSAYDGETLVTPGYPIDRGHANIAQRFNALGADVTAVTA